MQRAEALHILAGLQPELRSRFAVDSVFLVGSVVRDEATGSSDVDAEIQDAPKPVRETYESLLLGEHEYVHVTKEAATLAEAYLARKILSEKFTDDALHIGIATVAAVDLLVSWNFKHIVHFEKIRQFSAVNIENGFKPIEIYSPREVTTYGEEEV